MLTQEQAVEIRVMARRGESVRTIARELRCSRNTVRRYLRDEEAGRYSPRDARACKLDPYKSYLQERIEQARPRWIPATVLLREIAELRGALQRASADPVMSRAVQVRLVELEREKRALRSE